MLSKALRLPSRIIYLKLGNRYSRKTKAAFFTSQFVIRSCVVIVLNFILTVDSGSSPVLLILLICLKTQDAIIYRYISHFVNEELKTIDTNGRNPLFISFFS